MRPKLIATVVVATAVFSKGLLLNDNSAIEAYNANNLYRPNSEVHSNLNHETIPAYVEKQNENFKKNYDWAI